MSCCEQQQPFQLQLSFCTVHCAAVSWKHLHSQPASPIAASNTLYLPTAPALALSSTASTDLIQRARLEWQWLAVCSPMATPCRVGPPECVVFRVPHDQLPAFHAAKPSGAGPGPLNRP